MGLPFIKEAVSQFFSKPSTELYPFVEKEAPEGYRGRIVFHGDKCIGCGMCERVCAGTAISTHVVEDTDEGTTYARRFFLGSCTFCRCCADFCSTKAIELSKDYHMVARSEDDLVVEGSYFKKKKKPAAPKPDAPKPEEPKLKPGDVFKPDPEQMEPCPVPEAAPEEPAPVIIDSGEGKPLYNSEKCIYCNLCGKNCPAEAITVDRKEKLWAIDADACIGCGTCVEKCPKDSLTI